MMIVIPVLALVSIVASVSASGLGLLVIGDWGGEDTPPFTEIGQVA